MQGSGGRKIPLPPARLPAFLRKGGTPSACFCRKWVCRVQDRCGNGLVVPLVWRSLRGLFKPLCLTDRPTQTVSGRLWRVQSRGSCMARGPRGQGGSRAQLACEMRSSEHGAARQARPTQVNARQTARNVSKACQARLSISTRAELPRSSATVLHPAYPLPAKTGGRSALLP